MLGRRRQEYSAVGEVASGEAARMRSRRAPVSHAAKLFFQAERFYNGPVAIDVFELDIVQEPAAPADEHQQSATGVMVFLVNLQVFRQVFDAIGEQADLDLRGPGIGLVHLEFFDQRFLVLS
jgi:hypothetical protein